MRIAADLDRPAVTPSIGLAIVGAEFRTECAPRRQAEIDRCAAGERVTLRPLKRLVEGVPAVSVYSQRGRQIGYVSPSHADWARNLLPSMRAIFHKSDSFGAVIRVTTDGTTPTLPQPTRRGEMMRRPHEVPPEPVDEFCGINFDRWRRR
ncbi:hypothetical protein [Sphingobium yanoikuyae]|uniref:HIRAN domain-containing protein n=1 Tax=Sphingobium yanoikuyae TaxID=13690 RepID=A0A3G2UZ28_SPHYA|nr:hypothetical protein [Sphingobium yanoikuyae]AYO80095.1 hypothetical protein EBF16_26450 [Sphingobium yanoikuyae]